jgi:lipid II:glycine glycyltransferase (peptidoglycan interpeptide bridge formation enzyme)
MFDLPGAQSRIAVARNQQQAVAAVIFCHYRRTAGYLYGGTDFNFQELRPNNLIHAEIVRYLIEQGVNEYNLGMSLGQKELEHFKETLGAKRFFSVSLRRHRFPRLRRLLSKPPTLG